MYFFIIQKKGPVVDESGSTAAVALLEVIRHFINTYTIYLIDLLPHAVTIIVPVAASIRKPEGGSPPEGLGNPHFREER